MPCQVHAIYDYGSLLKVLGCTLIDFNRYTCFCLPMRHKTMWSGGQLKAAFVFIVGAPLIICGYRVANVCYYRIGNGAIAVFFTDNASQVVCGTMSLSKLVWSTLRLHYTVERS